MIMIIFMKYYRMMKLCMLIDYGISVIFNPMFLYKQNIKLDYY